MSTNFPLAWGSQATNAALSATSGAITTGARTGRPRGVPGLQASIVPSSERIRGASRSMCVLPRRQPRQVPYCSLRAVTPHDAYVATSQFCAASMPGDAVSRGPSESNSTCARRGSCELSVPIAQMRRSAGFSTMKPEGWGGPWAAAVVNEAAQSRMAATSMRGTGKLLQSVEETNRRESCAAVLSFGRSRRREWPSRGFSPRIKATRLLLRQGRRRRGSSCAQLGLPFLEGPRPIVLEQPRQGSVREHTAPRLAGGAVVRLVFRVADPLDGRAAHGAGASVPPVHGHPLAKRGDLFGELETYLGAQPLDPTEQGPLRRAVQPHGLLVVELPRQLKGRELRRVQDFVRVGVADAVEQPRIGEGALQGMRLGAEGGAKRRGVGGEHVEAAGIVCSKPALAPDKVQRRAMLFARLGEEERAVRKIE